jgi:hypothetical protein
VLWPNFVVGWFSGGLDVPIERPFAVRDWRFGHYEMEGLQDPLSSVYRYFREGAVFSSYRTNHRQKLRLDSKLAWLSSSYHGSLFLPVSFTQAVVIDEAVTKEVFWYCFPLKFRWCTTVFIASVQRLLSMHCGGTGKPNNKYFACTTLWDFLGVGVYS